MRIKDLHLRATSSSKYSRATGCDITTDGLSVSSLVPPVIALCVGLNAVASGLKSEVFRGRTVGHEGSKTVSLL